MNFVNNLLKPMASESEARFAMQRHETTFLVTYKPLKRREDAETSSSLCVDAKQV
jgi:hypothetical protein